MPIKCSNMEENEEKKNVASESEDQLSRLHDITKLLEETDDCWTAMDLYKEGEIVSRNCASQLKAYLDILEAPQGYADLVSEDKEKSKESLQKTLQKLKEIEDSLKNKIEDLSIDEATNLFLKGISLESICKKILEEQKMEVIPLS